MSNNRSISNLRKTSIWLIIVILGMLIFIIGYRSYRYQRFMSQYFSLLNSKTTESEVIRQEGKPNVIVASDEELHRWLKDFKPITPVPSHVESKVLIYYADPYRDGEGYIVYIFINRKDVVNHLSLAI